MEEEGRVIGDPLLGKKMLGLRQPAAAFIPAACCGELMIWADAFQANPITYVICSLPAYP